jgi:hypothetical protein
VCRSTFAGAIHSPLAIEHAIRQKNVVVYHALHSLICKVSGGKTPQTRDASSAHGAASGRLIATFRRVGCRAPLCAHVNFFHLQDQRNWRRRFHLTISFYLKITFRLKRSFNLKARQNADIVICFVLQQKR